MVRQYTLGAALQSIDLRICGPGNVSHHWAGGVAGLNLGGESDGDGVRGAATGRPAGPAIRAVGVGNARSERSAQTIRCSYLGR